MNFLHYINGQWHDSSHKAKLAWASGHLSEDLVSQLHHNNTDDRGLVEVALEGARLSHEQILRDHFFTLPERLTVIQNVSKILQAQAEIMASLISQEVAKPVSLSKLEVQRALATLESTMNAAENSLGPQAVSQNLRHLQSPSCSVFEIRKPKGPVFCVTPFNFPLNLVLHKIAPAIASGCPVILKVSPKSVRVGCKIVEFFEQSGLPPGMLNLIHADNQLCAEIIQDKRIVHTSFTGSDAVGWELKKLTHKPITLELGSNTGAYVHKDASLKKAAAKLALSAFGFAGQSCISLQNLFLHKDIFDNMRALMIQQLHQIKWGAPQDESHLCSWMIDDAAAKRAKTSIQMALQEGATLTAQAEPPRGWASDDLKKHSSAVAPTLLENVNTGSDISTRELFAPVLILHKVESEFDFYTWAQNANYRLQTSVWSSDIKTHLDRLMALDFGGVVVNESPSFRLDGAAYGGRGASGEGTEGPKHVIEALTKSSVAVVGF